MILLSDQTHYNALIYGILFQANPKSEIGMGYRFKIKEVLNTLSILSNKTPLNIENILHSIAEIQMSSEFRSAKEKEVWVIKNLNTFNSIYSSIIETSTIIYEEDKIFCFKEALYWYSIVSDFHNMKISINICQLEQNWE